MALNTLTDTSKVFDPRTELLSFSSCTNRNILLPANTSIQAAPINPNRIYLMLINLTDSVVFLTLGQGAALLGQGMVLFGKRSYLEIDKDFLFREKISAISETSAALSFVECNL